MPNYIITCDENATADEVKAAKDHVKQQGGKIDKEFSIIKGFTVEHTHKNDDGAVRTKEDVVSALGKHPSIKAVEEDGVMSIQ